MVNIDEILSVVTQKFSIYNNYSLDAYDILIDALPLITFTKSSDYIYVGYRKPIYQVYAALQTPNSAITVMEATYWNGNSWQPLEIYDATKSLSRDGFITWNPPEDWVSNLVDTVSNVKYWVRFTLDTTIDTTLYGISALFCDLQDCLVEYPQIDDPDFNLGKNLNYYFVAARNWIMTELERKGLRKRNPETNQKTDINIWDVLNASKLRQAATFYSLHKIFHSISDTNDDEFGQKADYYAKKSEKSLAMYSLPIDMNDDGKLQEIEKTVNIKHGLLVK